MAGNLYQWLLPSLGALLIYGLGQGFLKKWSLEVPPAKFCLFLFLAKAFVNIGYFIYTGSDNPFTAESFSFNLFGIIAYILDGLGWIFYFFSIVYGPITIVGTLSAAYPALTILFARFFLGEQLITMQYIGVSLVIFACLGLSYSPSQPGEENSRVVHSKWIPLGILALVCWGMAQTIAKHVYNISVLEDASGSVALLNTIGGGLTLGLYGLLKGVKGVHSVGEIFQKHSMVPTMMMAGGDLLVIIAYLYGPVSIVSPLTGAYPLVTLIFAAFALKEKITNLQWICIILLLFGIYFSTTTT